jgi:hypothetical protein
MIRRGELVAIAAEDPFTRVAYRVVGRWRDSVTIEPAWCAPYANRRVVHVDELELLPAFKAP